MTSSLQSPLEDGLPVIDISQFPKEIEGDHLQYLPEVVKLREACEEWGIFQAGEPWSFTRSSAKGYMCKPGFGVDAHAVKRWVHSVYFCQILQREYLNSFFLVAKKRFSSHGKSTGDEALSAHADRGCLTILHTDEEEGFEVRSKEGRWINVKPSPNSLIVNLGISLKAWSNGRFRCAVPRVICKGWQNRLAVPLFLSFADDARISAPEELVNENNARRYKPFIFCELQSELRKKFEKL